MIYAIKKQRNCCLVFAQCQLFLALQFRFISDKTAEHFLYIFLIDWYQLDFCKTK